jgi:serum/glucocorticoid-regulated kinase 2
MRLPWRRDECDPDPEDYMPPLVRAIILDDVEMLSLLLSHGADPNVGFHNRSLGERERPPMQLPQLGFGGFTFMEADTPSPPMGLNCGRPILLAAELGREEMADALLGAGADPEMAMPIWDVEGHECRCASRRLYLGIVAHLRAKVAARQQPEG